MNRKTIQTIFERFRVQNPKPTTELNYNSVFELLIAVILSAQATDVSVNKVTKFLFQKANTPKSMLQLGIDSLKDIIKSIGLYQSKASNIMKTCQILEEQHGGQVPNTRIALEQLPGVGRKTANVVLNTAFGEPTMAVDTHVFRVANRTGIAPGKTPLIVEQALVHNISADLLPNAHHWLILHGRYVCKAKKPECAHCLISDLCEYTEKNPPKNQSS